MDARRLDLDLSWKDLAAKAGLSDVSLRNFRKGRSEPNALSKRRIEDALLWQHGAVDSVLNGGEPESEEPSLEELEAARRLLQEALSLTDPEEMRVALASAVELIERAMEHQRDAS